MWSVLGLRLLMPVFALLWCQRRLLANRGEDQQMSETHLEECSWISKRTVTGRWILQYCYPLLIQSQLWTTTCKCSAFQCIRLTSLNGHIGGCPRSLQFEPSQGSHPGVESLRHSLITCAPRASPRQPLCQLFLKRTAKHWWRMELFLLSRRQEIGSVRCVRLEEGPRDYFHVAYATIGVILAAATRHTWAEFVHVMCEFCMQEGRSLFSCIHITRTTWFFPPDKLSVPLSVILNIDAFMKIRQCLGGARLHGSIFSSRNMLSRLSVDALSVHTPHFLGGDTSPPTFGG